MGLDIVEIIMEVEEEFGVSLRDDELQHVKTVGDLHEVILACLARKKNLSGDFCPSATAFYRLRYGFRSLWGIPRPSVLPSAMTRATLGSHLDRPQWQNLSDATQLRLPPLGRPRWLVRLLLVATLGAALWTGGWFWWVMGVPFDDSASIALLVVVLLASTLTWLTRPHITSLPANCHTIGGLAREVGRVNFGRLLERTGRIPDSDQVWETLKTLLVEQLALTPDQVTREARIIEDLGAG